MPEVSRVWLSPPVTPGSNRWGLCRGCELAGLLGLVNTPLSLTLPVFHAPHFPELLGGHKQSRARPMTAE